jgi:hypothetical protein
MLLRNITYRFIHTLLLLLLTAALHAQDEPPVAADDEITIEEPIEVSTYREKYDKRSFSESRLSELRSQKDFNYDAEDNASSRNGRQNYKNSENRQQRRGSGGSDNSSRRSTSSYDSDRGSANWTVILLIFAVVVLVMMVLLGLKPSFLFRRKGQQINPVAETDDAENIHAMKFETELEKAIRLKNFRLATRIMYLATLKQLSDRNMILWRPNKTNWDYVQEMNTLALKPGFRDITAAYDYAWYGEFPIDEAVFRLMQEKIAVFQKNIQQA